MHVVAVRAVKLILIMRRYVRIVRLDVLGLFYKRRNIVAARAVFNRWKFRLGHVHVLSVAHLAADALGDVSIGAELGGGSAECQAGGEGGNQ